MPIAHEAFCVRCGMSGELDIMPEGWIKLHRQIEELDLYFSERFTKTQAWIDLLLLANHKPATIYIRGNEIKLERGHLARSMKTLGMRWKWHEKTVKQFLIALSNRQMLHIRTSRLTTILTMINYNQYQGTDVQNDVQSTYRMTLNKNEKKEKKKYLNFVFLSDEEFEKLSELPDRDERIKSLDLYLGSTGKTYRSHYMTILSWKHREEKEKSSAKKEKENKLDYASLPTL